MTDLFDIAGGIDDTPDFNKSKKLVKVVQERLAYLIYSTAKLENLDNISSESVQYCLNMGYAWEFVLGNLALDDNVTQLIMLYRMITGKPYEERVGLREKNIRIDGTSWAPKIPTVDSLNKTLSYVQTMYSNPTDKALEYFCTIMRAQPFDNYNLTLASLVVNKILIAYGVGLFKIPDDLAKSFKASLISFYETNESTNFKLFLKKYCVFDTF